MQKEATSEIGAEFSLPLTVSELTSRIRNDLEHAYPEVLVEGELSNCKVAASGLSIFS